MAASRIVVDAGTIAHSYCRRVGGIITIDIEEVQIQYFRYITLLVVHISIESMHGTKLLKTDDRGGKPLIITNRKGNTAV